MWSSASLLPLDFQPLQLPPSTGGTDIHQCEPINPGDSGPGQLQIDSFNTAIMTNGQPNYTGYDIAIIYPQPVFLAAYLKATDEGSLMAEAEAAGGNAWVDIRSMVRKYLIEILRLPLPNNNVVFLLHKYTGSIFL
jgi:hypothetical protein